jgi:KUP system potassium uptake protein
VAAISTIPSIPITRNHKTMTGPNKWPAVSVPRFCTRNSTTSTATVLIVQVVTESIPYVAREDRVRARELGHGFWQVDAHFGFAETPNVPRALRRAQLPGIDLDPAEISFFVGRANIKSTTRPGMARWRERLYAGLARIATRPTEFFRVPADRVIELGAETHT